MEKPQNIIKTMAHFGGRDGIPSLWTGLSASWLRQCFYSTARFGLNSYFVEKAKLRTGQQKLSASWEIVCAGASGGLAGMIGNPTEIVLVRMCADGAREPSKRYNYSNSLEAVARIARTEKISIFARGLLPNTVRSVLMNVGQIATYSTAKRQLLASKSLGLEDGIATHFLSSLIAGTVATTICAPADVLKSRIQAAAASGGSLSTIIKESLQKEGPGFLMRGWTPAWLRLAPQTILTFVFMEQLKKAL
ncbi:hypothetical protein MBLNU457_6298t1 [Dothideomycetes sp. NU457]